MPERHALPVGREPANQVEAAIELRRQRDNADVWRSALDLREDFGAGEILALGVEIVPLG